MSINKYRKGIYLCIFFFLLSSISFLFIPFSDFNESGPQLVLAYLVGVFFWSGLLIGFIITMILGAIRKKNGFRRYKFFGLFCFFKNRYARICDVYMILSMVLCLIFQAIFGIHNLFSIILLSSAIFSIYLHSVLNGNNFAFAFRKGARK